MRPLKLAALLLILLVNAFALLSILSLRVSPALNEPTAEENGDIDGDGRRNVTDAVRLLQFLFQDGPAPVPVACAEGGSDCCADLVGEIRALRSAIERRPPSQPHPTDIVDLDGTADFGAQGGTRPIFQVPGDKWFVLKELHVEHSGALYQILDGEASSRRSVVASEAQPLLPQSGIKFPPGSQVAIHRSGSIGSPPRPYTLEFFLGGYLVRDLE